MTTKLAKTAIFILVSRSDDGGGYRPQLPDRRPPVQWDSTSCPRVVQPACQRHLSHPVPHQLHRPAHRELFIYLYRNSQLSTLYTVQSKAVDRCQLT